MSLLKIGNVWLRPDLVTHVRPEVDGSLVVWTLGPGSACMEFDQRAPDVVAALIKARVLDRCSDCQEATFRRNKLDDMSL